MNLRGKLIAFAAAGILALSACATSDGQEKAFTITKEAYSKYWGKDWPKVVESATKAIKAAPEYPWPYSVRGAAYNNMGKYDLALADLNKCLQLSPDFMPAFINRGITYLRKKSFEMAEKDFSSALKLAPNDLNALVWMSEVKSAMGKSSDSCMYMKKAIRKGFRNLEVVDENVNYEYLLYSDCFSEVMELYESAQSGKNSPPADTPASVDK